MHELSSVLVLAHPVKVARVEFSAQPPCSVRLCEFVFWTDLWSINHPRILPYSSPQTAQNTCSQIFRILTPPAPRDTTPGRPLCYYYLSRDLQKPTVFREISPPCLACPTPRDLLIPRPNTALPPCPLAYHNPHHPQRKPLSKLCMHRNMGLARETLLPPSLLIPMACPSSAHHSNSASSLST